MSKFRKVHWINSVGRWSKLQCVSFIFLPGCGWITRLAGKDTVVEVIAMDWVDILSSIWDASRINFAGYELGSTYWTRLLELGVMRNVERNYPCIWNRRCFLSQYKTELIFAACWQKYWGLKLSAYYCVPPPMKMMRRLANDDYLYHFMAS